MRLVGEDGELLLYATQDRKEGVLHNTSTGTVSEKQPLQVFFKWGNFESVEEADELA